MDPLHTAMVRDVALNDIVMTRSGSMKIVHLISMLTESF